VKPAVENGRTADAPAAPLGESSAPAGERTSAPEGRGWVAGPCTDGGAAACTRGVGGAGRASDPRRGGERERSRQRRPAREVERKNTVVDRGQGYFRRFTLSSAHRRLRCSSLLHSYNTKCLGRWLEK
jgi:hypothetical protein